MNTKYTVMIVDDHTLIRETWSMLLGLDKRFQVLLNTGDAQKAIDTARDKKPDLVLLDINMIPLSGFELLKIIRQHSPLTKVIGVSIHSEPAYAQKFIREGAKGYVTKNSTSEELLHAIEEVLAGKNYICNQVKDILSNTFIENDYEDRISLLSAKELEVINYIKTGQSSKEIAAELNISIKTVEVHRHNILKKLDVKNTASLLQLLSRHAL